MRSAIDLRRAAQAQALLSGRNYVIPDDVKELFVPVVAHRVLLAPLRETLTRRHFLRSGSHLLAGAAMARLGGALPLAAAPKAKRVIYLHMVGGPPQMDLFDPKPQMAEWYDKDLPESIRNGQRLTTMTSGQARFPIAPSRFRFDRYGESGMDLCELLPNLGKTVDTSLSQIESNLHSLLKTS